MQACVRCAALIPSWLRYNACHEPGLCPVLLTCAIPWLQPPAGKLFPGPHLYAGAAITVLWALAAALVPYMQVGEGRGLISIRGDWGVLGNGALCGQLLRMRPW